MRLWATSSVSPHSLATLYDAALDAGLWPDVLGAMRGVHRRPGRGSVFQGRGEQDRRRRLLCRYRRSLQDLYFEKYIKLDPLTVGHYFATVEEPVSVGDIIPYDEFLETRAYREWGKPQGFLTRLASLCSNHRRTSRCRRCRGASSSSGVTAARNWACSAAGQFGDLAALREHCRRAPRVLLDRKLALERDRGRRPPRASRPAGPAARPRTSARCRKIGREM